MRERETRWLSGKTDLLLLTSRPPQLETPVKYFRELVTPNDAMPVRWHLANIPTSVDLAIWRLKVHGSVDSNSRPVGSSRKIGNGAEAFDHNTTKRHEQLPVKLGTRDPLYFLMYATNAKISITQMEGQWPQSAFPTLEQRQEFVRNWPRIPDEKFKQYVLDWELRGHPLLPDPAHELRDRGQDGDDCTTSVGDAVKDIIKENSVVVGTNLA